MSLSFPITHHTPKLSIYSNVRRLDIQIDRLQSNVTENNLASKIFSISEDSDDVSCVLYQSQEIADLRAIVRMLSVTPASKPLLQPHKLIDLLSKARSSYSQTRSTSRCISHGYETDLLWLIAAKAAVQTLGLIVNTFLERTLGLSDEIRYWDEILGSNWYMALYVLQTSPSRLWFQTKDVYANVKRCYGTRTGPGMSSISARWAKFYKSLWHSIREGSQEYAKSVILSPSAVCISEARQKRKCLITMRGIHASSVGILIGECFSFGLGDEVMQTATYTPSKREWHDTVSKSVLLMETILKTAATFDTSVNEFEDGIFAAVESEISNMQDRLQNNEAAICPLLVIERLTYILQDRLPSYAISSTAQISEWGRPSRLIRYWLPASTILFSLSTVLQILTSRRAELLRWLLEFGSTLIDFWRNWVMEPVEKLIGTIRHDEKSEVAIISKNSLEADRASLERMVVDFVLDRPESGQQSLVTQADIDSITTKVKEGDLTPVLKAYERDLRKPFVGTVRGDLVRALLIQIQKTKVDVEIAIGGIDALLKSQELVFGYVLVPFI